VFVARGVRLASPPRTFKGEGLKLRLDAAGHVLEAIGWGLAPFAATLDLARPIDVAFKIERDEWNGESRLQARIADIRW
jgi:single-stranded-DNA-specific exonuclease